MRSSRSVSMWLIAALAAALMVGCNAPTGSRPPAQARTGEVSQCQPSVLLVARDENVEVATEWEKADLIVVGCRDRLQAITPEQRHSITVAVKTAGQGAGARTRTCRGLEQSSAPAPDVLTAINQGLGAAAISDWCWATRVGGDW